MEADLRSVDNFRKIVWEILKSSGEFSISQWAQVLKIVGLKYTTQIIPKFYQNDDSIEKAKKSLWFD